MTGKQKCKILRRIRRDIAAANQLDYTERDCTHEGACRGTCPYCEAQLKRLEDALAERRSLGKRIAVMGLSMGLLTTNLASCDPLFGGDTLQGDMAAPEMTDTEQTVQSDIVPGEIIDTQTTTEPIDSTMIEGLMPAPETVTMGEIVPSEETLMGDLILVPDEEDAGTTTAEAETTELMGTVAVTETAIAGGISPADFLPDPEAQKTP